MEKQDPLSLLEYTLTLDTDFLPCTHCFSPHHLWTSRKPYTPSRRCASLLLTKELPSQPMKCTNGLMLVECSGLPTLFTTLTQLASQKMLDWTFEDPDTASARWQYLAGLGHVLLERYICSESASSIWYCFSNCQDSHTQ